MRASLVVAVLVASVGLGGCAGVNKLINGDPKPVDPSQELTFQPLSIPPDYAVVPQTSAAAAPSDQSAGGQADTSQSSTGSGSDLSASPSPDVSAGEQALLDAANADKANPDIRALIASDSTASEGLTKSLTDALILGTPADQAGAATPKSGGAGALTPTITREQPSALSGIFN